jgi:hypothetical protein
VDSSSFAVQRQIKHSTKRSVLQEKTKIIVRRIPTKIDKNEKKRNKMTEFCGAGKGMEVKADS